MKNAKFVIMLQVCFLIGIFVFSASAVYQPEQITPCAITNLALRQDGLELASPKEHEAYLFSYDALDNFKEMADALKSGEAIENRENVKAIHGVGTDNPVYLISFTCTQEGSKNGKQFYYIIAPKDPQLPEITNLVNEDSKEISEALGVFIAPSLTKPLTDVVEAAKTSSAGRDLVSPWLHIDKDELEASITRLKSASQMPFEEESNDLAIKRNINRDTIILTAMHEIEEIGFDAAYTVAPDKLTVLLTKLLADKSLLIQQQAAFAIVETKGPIAYRALGTLIELLKDDSASVIERKKAEEAILDIGYSALPLLDKELVLFDKQLELVLLDKELEGDYPELTEIIQGIKASVKEIPRTSSSGIVDDKEAIKSLFNALQSQGLTNKERTSIIESLRTRITDLFSYVGYTEQSMKNNAIDAIVEIRAVITSALNTIEETLVGKEYAGTMIDLVNNIESFRGRPFEVQPKDISPELYRELFGSLAIQGRNINSKAINNINLEAAGQNFEELQAQLKEAKSKEDNGIQVPVDVMTALIRSVNAAELNLLALQREKYILDMREDAARTSSGGIDKATEIKEQIEVAQVYMDNLTSKLEKAMVERDIANQKGTANDFALADIEVEKLKESIALNQKDIDDRVDVIAGILNEQNEIKASSGGLLPSHQQILDSLKSDQANLTTLAGLQTNISQTASEYRQLSVSSTSAESEQAYNLQYLGDTGAIIESTLFANEIFQNKEPFYILFDKNQFPENQFAIAERVREIERLKESMNCIVIRGDINNIPKGANKNNCIAFSSNTEDFKNAGVSVMGVSEIEANRYMKFITWAVIGKASIILGQDPSNGRVRTIMTNAYKLLTGEPLPTEMLENYIKDPANFIITIVLPEMYIVYEEGELENLHMQATEALKAA